jgi:predicted MPP superfamily phosphohydrolase
LGLPDLGRKYVEGWFRLGGLQLYVNRGIGTVGLPFRINCPPEITLITLRAG